MYLTRLAALHRMGPDTSLLVNALSGALDVVNDGVRAKLLDLRDGRRPVFEDEHRRLLLERGYLFQDEAGEREALQNVYKEYQRFGTGRPLEFVVCPTYACNLNCTYCFESSDLRARPEVMTSEQVADLFAAFEPLAARRPGRAWQIVLFGGEPLLPTTEGVVGEIFTRAGDVGASVQIVTNGTHVSRFAPLLRRHLGTVRGAQITLDGPEAIHDERRKSADGRGSFRAVVEAVDICLDSGIEVNLRVNIDAHNIGALRELVGLVAEREWHKRKGFQCQLAPVTDHLGTSTYPHRMSEESLVEPVLEFQRRYRDVADVVNVQLFRVLQHLISVIEQGRSTGRTIPRFQYCEADRGDVVAFGPDGFMYVCPESAGDAESAIGTYSPRYELWEHRLQPWENRSVLTLPECRDCEIATFCGGGCAYAALRQFGSPQHGVCTDAPQVVKAYMRMLRKRFEDGETPWAPPPGA